MSLLAELKGIAESLNIPVETGVFSDIAPDEYIVLTPMTDTLSLFGDNSPSVDIQEVRISLYTKNNYTERKNQLTEKLLKAEITITDRRYIGHKDDTGYHHYAIDTANFYETEE